MKTDCAVEGSLAAAVSAEHVRALVAESNLSTAILGQQIRATGKLLWLILFPQSILMEPQAPRAAWLQAWLPSRIAPPPLKSRLPLP